MGTFDDGFQSLTGFLPMQWQRRLWRRFIENSLPSACDIPTGLGKTSVIPIWLLSIVRQAEVGKICLPRRLVYVVNRRTVVDQATRTVEQMRDRLLDPEAKDWRVHAQVLRNIAATLHRLCGCSTSERIPLGLSTLRGELADNEEWKADPARPAVVVGTVDMIGSKLLFSGYGDGRYGRAHHAGLIGYDALIVHDEAHLTPAFSSLLRSVAREQEHEAARGECTTATARTIRVLELSATRRDCSDGAPQDSDDIDHHAIFRLEKRRGDLEDGIVRERLAASKCLHVHRPTTAAVVDEIVKLALEHEASRSKVLIYVRTPARAQDVARRLSKLLGAGSDDRVALLTGTMRGHERDILVKNDPVYRAMLELDRQVEKSVYLVSTSAGEVGIDLDADHLVCDLTTLDALIQRLGRVNRRGGSARAARIDVVVEVDKEKEKKQSSAIERAIATTLTLLEAWEKASTKCIRVGPQDLGQLLADAPPEAIKAAFSPEPATPLLTDILLDAWSLTSIDDTFPGRVGVAPFLHGLTSDPPETHVAWRREISFLDEADADEAALRDWFRACRIESREKLRDRTDVVKKALAALLGNLRRVNSSADFRVVLLDESGRAAWHRVSSLAAKDTDLAYCTVVFPETAGGLDKNGMLDPHAPGRKLDVAEHDPTDRRRERWLHQSSSDGDWYTRLISGALADVPPDDLREKERVSLRHADGGSDESETKDLVLLVSPRESALDNPETASACQTLMVHTNAIVAQISRIAERLGIDDPIQSALIEGARRHDTGKGRPVWQLYARNPAGTELLAKAPRYLNSRALGGYRHEFGSLLDATNELEARQRSESELVLHLIAAHHGWARPHFEPRSFDGSCTTAANEQALAETVRRFGQLQQKYGRWCLAWLESLVRCADIAASQDAAGSTKNRGWRS